MANHQMTGPCSIVNFGERRGRASIQRAPELKAIDCIIISKITTNIFVYSSSQSIQV